MLELFVEGPLCLILAQLTWKLDRGSTKNSLGIIASSIVRFYCQWKCKKKKKKNGAQGS